MKNRKPALVCLAIVAAVLMTAINGSAQIVGYQVAIAPTIHQPFVNQPIFVPGFVQPIITQPIIVPVMPQATFGFLPTQAPPIVVRSPFHHGQPVVTVPNTVFIPGPVFVPPPQAHFGPPVPQVIVTGTPRAHVISQLGQPSVTVVTSTGETMHFNGGVTVIIRNGQVVSGTR